MTGDADDARTGSDDKGVVAQCVLALDGGLHRQVAAFDALDERCVLGS